MTQQEQMVYIVDDDEAVRDSLMMLLKSAGISAASYPSAQMFLEQDLSRARGCLVLDIRMPGMNGLELQDALLKKGIHLPIIFITGHGDVPMAVEAMKKGAVDFVQKPFNDDELLHCIEKALSKSSADSDKERQVEDIKARLDSLTPRERQVMEMVVAGKANKVIAIDLNISQRTVEIHRANMMEKMRVRSVAELVQKVMHAGQLHSTA